MYRVKQQEMGCLFYLYPVEMDEVKAWQNRPLDSLYPILFLDVLYIKIRDQGHITSKAIHLVLGINLEGRKEILGIWIILKIKN